MGFSDATFPPLLWHCMIEQLTSSRHYHSTHGIIILLVAVQLYQYCAAAEH
jgi:hypothetical protein